MNFHSFCNYSALFYNPQQLGLKITSDDNRCALVLYALEHQHVALGHGYYGREKEFWSEIEKKHIVSDENPDGIYTFQDKAGHSNFRAQVKRLYDVDLDQEIIPPAPKKRARPGTP